MTAAPAGSTPFQAHVELLRQFLAARERIVEGIQGLLNAQGKPASLLEDRVMQARHVEACFFGLAGLDRESSSLRGQLRQAHRAKGFIPSPVPGVPNDVVDPGEMAVRAFGMWRQTRWPGRNARLRYAHTLYNLYLLQCLELLSMRTWDAGAGEAGQRLALVQGVLDQLWQSSPPDQPVLVRDARWLIALAQSPANEGLAPYLEVAAQVAENFSTADQLGIHRAGVVLAGGHLRSQLRHYQLARGESLSDRSLILRSRRSNALDFSTTIQSLVPLLRAYGQAVQAGEVATRHALASVICQGLSPDPELFVNRVDLLGAYSMIEHLFVAAGEDGRVGYTPAGHRHVQLLQQYAGLIGSLAASLHQDCGQFRPLAGRSSPYGLLYGFANNLLEHMAARTLLPDTPSRFSLEDAFTEDDGGADKLAWVSSWRQLPHMSPEVQKLYAYPQQFAEEIFRRIELALGARAAGAGPGSGLRSGRLYVPDAEDPASQARASQVPDLPAAYLVASDPRFVAEHGAEAWDQERILHDRNEGELAVSYQSAGGWVGVTKDFVTDVLAAERDARVACLPREAAAVLRLMCPDLIAP